MADMDRPSARRQYEQMLAAARVRLRDRNPAQIAALAGLDYDADERRFRFASLGCPVGIAWPDLRALAPLDEWHHLTLLQVMAGADGAMPDDRWMALSELPSGGVSRGDSFDRDIRRAVGNGLSALSPDDIRRRCAAMGRVLPDAGPADLCAELDFAPRWPLRLLLWFADDEFPASGKVLVNRGVGRWLGVEAAGTAAMIAVGRLAAGDDR